MLAEECSAKVHISSKQLAGPTSSALEAEGSTSLQ